MKILYRFTEKDAPYLRAIHGRLFRVSSEFIHYIKDKKIIVSIGDRVTYTLISAKIIPFISIIDLKEQNRPVQDIKTGLITYNAKTHYCKNPRGTVSSELVNCLKKAFNNRDINHRLIIDGEEDLAGIPATLLAPEGSYIAYGMPNIGICCYIVTEKEKSEVLDLLDIKSIEEIYN